MTYLASIPTTSTGPWSDQQNILQDNALYAYTEDLDDNLDCYGFYFDNIAANCNIVGIEVRCDAYKDDSWSNDMELWFQLSYDGGTSWTPGTPFKFDLGLSEVSIMVGGPTETWSHSWTRSEIVTGLRLRIAAKGGPILNNPQWRVSYVRVGLYYTNTTSLLADAYAMAPPEDDGLASRLVGEGFATAGPSEDDALISGSGYDVISSEADFFSVSRARQVQESLAVYFALRIKSGSTYFPRVIQISDGSYVTDAASAFQDGLIAVRDVHRFGAAGVESATFVQDCTVVITQAAFQATNGLIEKIPGHVQGQGLVGSGITINSQINDGLTRGGSKWVSWPLFLGFVYDVRFTEGAVELYCVQRSAAATRLPRHRVNSSFMVLPPMGGEAYPDADGALVPIGMGRFDWTALENQTFFGGSTTDARSAILPQLLGYRHPVIPLVGAWQKGDPYEHLGFDRAMEASVLVYGDVATFGAGGSMRLQTTSSGWLGTANLEFPGPEISFSRDTTGEVRYTAISSWADDPVSAFSSASPVMLDLSTYGWQDKSNGAGEVASRDVATQTELGSGTWPNTFPVLIHSAVRHENEKRFQQPLFQVKAFPMQGLSKGPEWTTLVYGPSGGAPDDIDFQTNGVTNPLNAIDTKDLNTYANFAGSTSRAGYAFPIAGTSLGTIVAVRVCWLNQTGGSSDVRVAARMSPASLFPLIEMDYNVSPLSWRWSLNPFYPNTDLHVAFQYNASSRYYGSMWISRRYTDDGRAQINQSDHAWQSHGFANIAAWEFLSWGKDSNGVGLDQYEFEALLYQPEVVFWNNTSTSFKLHAVWIEVLYQSRFAKPIEQWTDTSIYERYRDYRIKPLEKRRPNYTGDTYFYSEYFAQSNIDPNKPRNQPIGVVPMYVSGRGPFDDSNGNVTGSAGQLIEKGSEQAHYLLGLAAVASSRQTGSNVFGSFDEARTYLSSHKLSTLIDTETTLGECIDRLAMQSKGFCQEQITSSQFGLPELRWRFFVDDDDLGTNQPERMYRGGYTFYPEEIIAESFTVEQTPLSEIANSFTLRYGMHRPTNDFVQTHTCNKDGCTFATDASTYKTLCSDSVNQFLLEQEQVIEMPDVWRKEVAEDLLKWHIRNRVQRKLVVTFETFIGSIDIQPGHVIYFHNDMAAIMSYPGQQSGANWQGHGFVVTEVWINKDIGSPTVVRIKAVENND